MAIPRSMLEKFKDKKVKVTCKNCGAVTVKKFQYRFRCYICGFNTKATDAKIEQVEDA